MTSNTTLTLTGGRFLEYDGGKVRDIEEVIESIKNALKV